MHGTMTEGVADLGASRLPWINARCSAAALLALGASLSLLGIAACSSQHSATPRQNVVTAIHRASNKAVTCLPPQLAFSLDDGDGRFNGMSHSGTSLVLRNIGTAACTVAAQPALTLADANQQALNIAAQDAAQLHADPAQPIMLAPAAIVSSDMRWISSDVFDHGHCETPAMITLALGQQMITALFQGHLCGEAGKPSSYTLTTFKPAEAPEAAAATKSVAYACQDGRTVRAVYLDRDTVALTLDGQTHRLHTAVSADGARYVGDRWQWWTKGMHQAQLAPLNPGETIASARGTTCTAS